ncbi:MAG TPA: hypothetical protein VG501_12115 [Rhizomicrobium sp.]|jgi:hypothetical protein|nr:hypothetical protein [Rhizomicrobium sp.]HWC64363.1 hypothetical protein [Rhizomicrobium sp.]
MSGSKTHEQFVRSLERKPDVDAIPPDHAHAPKAQPRRSEFPVSARGMNQESSQAKHNRPAKGAAKH